MRSFHKQLTAVLLGAATIAGVFLPAATAVAAPAAPASSLSAAGEPGRHGGVKTEIFEQSLDLTFEVARAAALSLDRHAERPGYVKSLREAARYAAGERYNVMVIRWDHEYHSHIRGRVYDAKISTDGYEPFRVVVFDTGTVVNHGEGGYRNWAFWGCWKRDGGAVEFTTAKNESC